MTSSKRHFSSILAGLITATVCAVSSPPAYANVYATNIKLNGGIGDAAVGPGGKVTISYILNDDATAGLAIKILSGTNAVRTINISGTNSAALKGLQSVVWDGLDSGGNALALGAYSVSIMAAANGYAAWTQFTDDNNDATYVWEGRGIAIDRNPSSRYYGRIFVANSQSNYVFGATLPGDNVGILKLNADGSPGDEGGFSDGGYPWAGDLSSPWHVEVSDDDFVYINDWSMGGKIIRWDPTLPTNSMQLVLRPDNWLITSNADGTLVTNNLGGPAIFGTGNSTQIWLADSASGASRGVVRYSVTNSAVATNDVGITVVAVSVGTNLTVGPYDVALDKAGNIYTIQGIATAGDPSERVFRFPAYDPSTNGLAPETNATWAVGSADDTYEFASGLALDPTGTYLAVAFRGPPAGNTRILYATNGIEVTNLDLNIDISGTTTHDDTDCAWDAVGNVYYIDNAFPAWRAVSPPGANQATTVAMDKIQVGSGGGSSQIVITNIKVATGVVTLTFTAVGSATASAFTVLGSASPEGGYSAVAGATVTGSAGVFQATFPATGAQQFFRIQTGAAPPPVSSLKITNIAAAGGTVTLAFTSVATDTASMFTVLNSPTVEGGYSAAGATVTGGGGVFQATVPATGVKQFYRIQK
jgi:hypothetical protein